MMGRVEIGGLALSFAVCMDREIHVLVISISTSINVEALTSFEVMD